MRPAFDEIDSQLAVLTEFREKPAGTVRITTPQHAAESLLWPTIERLARDYPDVKFELSMESALVNLVTQRFDAAVRLGEQVAKDMIAVRIGPGMCMAAIGAPEMRIRPRFSPWVAATGGLKPMILLVGAIGIEPTTPTMSRWCSNQLSYAPEGPRTLPSSRGVFNRLGRHFGRDLGVGGRPSLESRAAAGSKAGGEIVNPWREGPRQRCRTALFACLPVCAGAPVSSWRNAHQESNRESRRPSAHQR